MKTVLIALMVIVGINAHAISPDCQNALRDLKSVFTGEEVLHATNFSALTDVQSDLLQAATSIKNSFDIKKPEVVEQYLKSTADTYKDFVFHQTIVWNSQKELRGLVTKELQDCMK